MTTSTAPAEIPAEPEPAASDGGGRDVHVLGRRVVQFLVDVGLAAGLGAGASALFVTTFSSAEYGGPAPFAVVSTVILTALAWFTLFVTVPAITGGRALLEPAPTGRRHGGGHRRRARRGTRGGPDGRGPGAALGAGDP